MIEDFKWQTTTKQHGTPCSFLSRHYSSSGSPGALNKTKHDKIQRTKSQLSSTAFQGSNLAYYINNNKRKLNVTHF